MPKKTYDDVCRLKRPRLKNERAGLKPGKYGGKFFKLRVILKKFIKATLTNGKENQLRRNLH